VPDEKTSQVVCFVTEIALVGANVTHGRERTKRCVAAPERRLDQSFRDPLDAAILVDGEGVHQKVSFGAVAALAGLQYEEFHYRLKEHFAIDDETARDDLRLADEFAAQHS
jgi:hypothetical protein